MLKNSKIPINKILFYIVILLNCSVFSDVLAVNVDITKRPEYKEDSGMVEYIAVSVKASNDIRFRTIGWYPYIKINGRHYGAIAESNQRPVEAEEFLDITTKILEPGQTATFFEMPLTETKDSMIEVIKHAYSVNNGGYNRQVFDDIENVFFQGKTIYLNACIVVKHDEDLLGGFRREQINWNPGKDSAEFTKEEGKSGKYHIIKSTGQVAFKKETAMYHFIRVENLEWRVENDGYFSTRN